jgi:hypothetical protein
VHTLYVVRHGAREAVEVFELDASGSGAPTATWVGCVVAPEGTGLNSVAHLPDGAFAATNFNMAAGEVWEWTPGGDWAEVPGSETAGPNGIEASSDGRWLYIGGWGTQSLIRLSRGREPLERDEVPVGFHVDNVRFSPDGSLLAAGHRGASVAAVFNCLQSRQCDGVTSHVALVDPEALAAEELVRYPSNESFILGTVGLRVGDEIWLGQVGGGDRIGRFPVAGSRAEPSAHDAPAGLAALIGTWRLTGDSPYGALEHVLVVREDGSATYESTGQVSEVRNLAVLGDMIAFEMTVYGGPNSYEMSFSGGVDEAGLTGELTGSTGSFATLTAARE